MTGSELAKIFEDWLKSDDVYIVDDNGKVYLELMIDCKKGSLESMFHKLFERGKKSDSVLSRIIESLTSEMREKSEEIKSLKQTVEDYRKIIDSR